MRPDHGGRLELKLESSSDGRVVYGAELSTADVVASGKLVLDVTEGSVQIELEGEPPAWLVDYARAVARTLWRSHADAGWPRRVTRWRPQPEPKA